jgi:hypothetical protein
LASSGQNFFAETRRQKLNPADNKQLEAGRQVTVLKKLLNKINDLEKYFLGLRTAFSCPIMWPSIRQESWQGLCCGKRSKRP